MPRLKTILIALICALSCLYSYGQDTSVQESQRAKLQREISLLENQLKDNKKLSNNALSELTLVRKQLQTRKSLLAQSDKEIRALDDSIRLVRTKVKQAQDRIDTLSVYYERLIRSAYKNRDTRLWYLHLLSSSDLGQASRRYMYLKGISSQINTQATKLKELQQELNLQLDKLSKLRAEASTLRAARQKELEKVKAEEKRSNSLIANLNRNKTKYQKQLNTKRKQVEKLNKEIERIIADYVKSSKSGSGKKAAPIDIKLAAEFEANKGKLPWPADGPVLEKFGKHNHPVYKHIQMPFNNGIGICLGAGEAVYAVFDGEVKNVIVMPGYNKCVLVQHGSYFSFYCKLAQVSVKAGDKIKTGQSIGIVDTIDGQTLLHFQIWKEKTPQNPENWLRKR